VSHPAGPDNVGRIFFARSRKRDAEWSNHTACRSRTNMENRGLMLQTSKVALSAISEFPNLA
jgi:hypothetical protein